MEILELEMVFRDQNLICSYKPGGLVHGIGHFAVSNGAFKPIQMYCFF